MDSKQKFTEKVSNELNSLLIFILLLPWPSEEHGQAAQEHLGNYINPHEK